MGWGAMKVDWTPETSRTPATGQHDLGHVHHGAVEWPSPFPETSQKTLELKGLKKLKVFQHKLLVPEPIFGRSRVLCLFIFGLGFCPRHYHKWPLRLVTCQHVLAFSVRSGREAGLQNGFFP